MAMELLTAREAAKFLKISMPTLEKWRLQGRGPQFIKVGRLTRYDMGILEAWLMSKVVNESPHRADAQKEEELLTSKEAAALLHRSDMTLLRWRQEEKGPGYRKIGSRIYYNKAIVEAWIKENLSQK